MKRKAFFNIASSSLIIGASMVGCSGAALKTQAGASAGKMREMASAQARDAENAIAKHDAGRAIQIAEAAVAASPHDKAYRTLLGRAYMLDGRFGSARAAFEDAVTLGSTDTRTIVNLALIRVVQGDRPGARALLSGHIADLPAADYGLAMTMAGYPDEAIRVLSQAIHDPAATARERQNLAYAYAVAGQWAEARLMASADLAPADAARRVLGWAQSTQRGAESQRVLAMIGVAPRSDDAGMPVRLALAPPPPSMAPVLTAAIAPASNDAPLPPEITPIDDDAAPTALAQAEPVPVAPKAPVAVTQAAWTSALAAPRPVSAPVAIAPMAVPPVSDAPVWRGKDIEVPAALAAAPVVPATPVMPAQLDESPYLRSSPSPLVTASLPKARPVTIWRPVDPAQGSAWVVQLGAFSTPENAAAAWNHFVNRNDRIANFPIVRTEATVDGRLFHRVAIAGFGDRSQAVALCDRVRAEGGTCFVRLGGAEAAPSRWALARPSKLLMASR